MTAKSEAALKDIAWFLFWLVVFSAPIDAFSVYLGYTTPMISRITMWAPGSAALVTCLIRRIRIDTLGWHWPKWRFIGWSYFLPWFYALPVYFLAWLLIPGALDWSAFVTQSAQPYHVVNHAGLFAAAYSIPTTLIFAFLSTMMWALGEELGWRGFLQPRMGAWLGTTKGALVVGLIWAAWHYPVLLGADYNSGTPPAYALTCFTLTVVSMAVISGWLRTVSASIWPSVVLHAIHNTLIQAVLDAMTNTHGRAPYVTTEFGFGMTLTMALTAFVVVRVCSKMKPARVTA